MRGSPWSDAKIDPATRDGGSRRPRATVSSVLRRVLVLLCAVVLVQETNLGSLIFGAECFETCPNDISPRHCSPTCAACSCGTHTRPAAAKTSRLAVPTASKSHNFVDAVLVVGDLHLSEILHVPKRFVA